MDTLKKEMYKVGVAFEILEDGSKALSGWTKVMGHLVWDVKMDFTRKPRWVLDCHKTPDLVGLTYMGGVQGDCQDWLPLMDLTSLLLTSGMSTFRCQALAKITSSVDLSLVLRMKERLPLFIMLFMVASQPEGTSGTPCFLTLALL